MDMRLLYKMLSVIIPTLFANLATTGCALLLVRKGPTRRLKILTFTVGLMSLAQTASFFHSQGFFATGVTGISHLHQILAAGLSLVAIIVLTREIYDRTLMDRRLRLIEHEVPAPAVEAAKADAGDGSELHQESVRATTDLLMMLNAVSSDESAKPSAPAKANHEMGECPRCQQVAREMAAAWLELHLYLDNKESDVDQVNKARERVSRVMQSKRQHELRSGHDLLVLSLPKEHLNGTFQMAG